MKRDSISIIIPVYNEKFIINFKIVKNQITSPDEVNIINDGT